MSKFCRNLSQCEACVSQKKRCIRINDDQTVAKKITQGTQLGETQCDHIFSPKKARLHTLEKLDAIYRLPHKKAKARLCQIHLGDPAYVETLEPTPTAEGQPPSSQNMKVTSIGTCAQKLRKIFLHIGFSRHWNDFEYVHERLHVDRLLLWWRRWRCQENRDESTNPKNTDIIESVRARLEHFQKSTTQNSVEFHRGKTGDTESCNHLAYGTSQSDS